MAKNYPHVSFLSVVSKVFEELKNYRLIDHLEKCSFLFNFQYGFKSYKSIADPLTIVSNRIARAFNKSRATRAVVLDISKVFDRVQDTGLLHRSKSYGISGQVFGVISSFLVNSIRWLFVVLVAKYSQEYPVNTGVP